MANTSDYWRERWQENQIGFHKEVINQTLLTYFPGLNLKKGSRILVPLCGKSVDMMWLVSQGYNVVGIELSDIAIKAFFKEQQLEFKSYQVGDFVIYESEHIKLFQGDLFKLKLSDDDQCDGYYDRAALIALPPDLQQAYVDKLETLLNLGAKGLVSTLDYDYSEQVGPPFNVANNTFQKLYSKFTIQVKSEVDEAQPPGTLEKLGIKSVREYVYQVSKCV